MPEISFGFLTLFGKIVSILIILVFLFGCNSAQDLTTLEITYDGCGDTVGCFGLPEGCVEQNDCEIFVKFSSQNNSDEGFRFNFELFGKQSTGQSNTNGYVGVGLSEDNSMGSDAVIGCYLNGVENSVIVEEFFNPGKYTKRVLRGANEKPTILLNTNFTTYEDGIIKCKFAISPVVNITQSGGKVFELIDQKMFILLSRGPSRDILGRHPTDSDRGSSPSNVYLAGPYSGYNDCERESITQPRKGCFGLPRNCILKKNCELFVKFFKKQGQNDERNETLFDFELIGAKVGRSPNGYIAVGMSDNGQMNSDSVFGCYMKDGQVTIGEFFNIKETKGNMGVARVRGDEVIVTEGSSSSYEDGFIRCKFTVKSMINLTQYQGDVFDLLEQRVYLLLARGDSASSEYLKLRLISLGGLGYHPKPSDRGVSEDAIYLSDAIIIEEQSTLGISIHGLLLIVAWIFFAPVGMFTARYYKQTFTDFKPNRKAFWFGMHQMCMFSVSACTVIGIIVIFLQIKGYSAQMNDAAQTYHPILGLMVLGLTILQVLISFCRPDPTHEKRFIFNWIHWTIGTLAHITAIACIYLANDLRKANLRGQTRFSHVVTFFILFHLFMHAIMTYLTRYNDRKREIDNEFRSFFPGPLRPTGDTDEIEGTALRAIFLVLELLGTAIAATLLSAFVFESL